MCFVILSSLALADSPRIVSTKKSNRLKSALDLLRLIVPLRVRKKNVFHAKSPGGRKTVFFFFQTHRYAVLCLEFNHVWNFISFLLTRYLYAKYILESENVKTGELKSHWNNYNLIIGLLSHVLILFLAFYHVIYIVIFCWNNIKKLTIDILLIFKFLYKFMFHVIKFFAVKAIVSRYARFSCKNVFKNY